MIKKFEQFCNENESSKEKKVFSNLYSWKKFVIDSGNRYKLQKATDLTSWIAFSDENAETKGLFKTLANYEPKVVGSPSVENDDLAGEGWAIV